MSKREFNPRALMRKLSPDLRDKLLRQTSLLSQIEKHTHEKDPKKDQTYFAWSRIPEPKRAVADRDLRRVWDMCCDKGRFYLIHAAHDCWPDDKAMLDAVEDMTNHDLAVSVYLASQKEFETAYARLSVDDYSFRIKRKGKDSVAIDSDEMKKQYMSDGITSFFKRNHQGYRRCSVEDFSDKDKLIIFVYHEKRKRPEDVFDKKGQLVTDWRKSVEAAMCVYYKSNGVLMVKAKEKKLSRELITLMGKVYFNDPLFFESLYLEEFSLQTVLKSDFEFSLLPGEGTTTANITSMTFIHPSASVGKLTMQCKGDHRKALRDMKLDPQKIKLDALKIETWGDGQKYKNRRCIDIRLPDICNLTDTARDRSLADMIERSGITGKENEQNIFKLESMETFDTEREIVRNRIESRYAGANT